MENNKKNLILSIVGIIVLVITVIGVSFAMYTFTGNGTKENTIQTGTISMSFNPDNNFVVSGQYPMTDSKGIATTTNKATFGVNATWGTAKMTINYDLGLTAITEGTTLTEEHIKVALLDGEGSVLVGTQSGGQLTGGVTIASLADKDGAHGLIKNYALTSGTITASGTTDNYTILAYVADTYDLPTDKANTTTDNGGNQTTTGLHKEQTGSETFKFKITIKASQVTGDEVTTSNAVYRWSMNTVTLGASKDSIGGYTTDYTTIWRNHFLKHNIGSNNTVESNEVCYILNDNMYCLKGCSKYNDDEGVCEVTNFEENKTILLESFGEDNCSIDSNRFECSGVDFSAFASDSGEVNANTDSSGCGVFDNGSANCTEVG